MICFELKGGAGPAERFCSALTLPVVAASLGGVESLIVRPAAAIHSGLSAGERAEQGIAEGLMRFSPVWRQPRDLIADFSQALDRAFA